MLIRAVSLARLEKPSSQKVGLPAETDPNVPAHEHALAQGTNNLSVARIEREPNFAKHGSFRVVSDCQRRIQLETELR